MAAPRAFDDMTDDLPFVKDGPNVAPEGLPAPDYDTRDEEARRVNAEAAIAQYFEPCKKCRGSGTFTGYSGRSFGQCFTCKGAGKMGYRQPAEVREKQREQRVVRKVRQGQTNVGAFAESNRAAWDWINANPGFGFAVAMLEAISKYGHLTPNQLAAVERCIAKSANREQAAAERVAAAPEVTFPAVEAAFAAAVRAGIRSPRLTLAALVFKPAKAHSVNAGAIYVCESEIYLGKVMNGRFMKSRDCTDEQQARILAVAADPKAAAIAYGKEYGVCCVCNRELSDPVSVAAGIGPVCAGRMGW